MEYTPNLIQTFEAEGLKKLQLEIFSGDITLIGHEENIVKVEVFATVRSLESLFFVREPIINFDSKTITLSMKENDETLRIVSNLNYLHPYNWVNFVKTSFRIYVPKSIYSVSRTYGGKVFLKNLTGNHNITTWGGNLFMENSSGNLQGKTMGGKIEIIKCEGKIRAKTLGGEIYLAENQAEIFIDTKGGNISVQKHKGQIQAGTWGGNIEASDIYGSFECNTAGGNIYLKNNNGNIGVSTLGGNIRAEMPFVNQYAWFDTAGGNIDVALPLDSPIDLEVFSNKINHPEFMNFEGYITKQEIKGKLNGGGATITIKSRGGKVSIKNNTTGKNENSESEMPETHPDAFNSSVDDIPADEFVKRNIKLFIKQPEMIEKKSFSINIDNFFFTLIFCLLLGYGLSGITYFTLEFVNPKSILSNTNKVIFFSNIAKSFGSLFAIYTFIHLLDSKIRSNWAKYLILILITMVYIGIFQGIIINIFYWIKVDMSVFQQDRNNNSVIYAFLPVIVSCSYFFSWQRTRQISRKISEQEYQLLNLEKLKSKAQLDALEARINPHFLYNSLNSIAGLIYEMPEKAEEMTIQLSKLFRYTTGRNEDNFHTIADELEIIKSYLAIEQVRFGNRLQYSIDCDEEILPYRIPRFLLQPLVENAIKHGISKVAHDGKIKIEIHRNNNTVSIKIHDNGPDFSELLGGGFGLRSIKEKLKLVYAEKATFDIKNEPEKAVIITLPAD